MTELVSNIASPFVDDKVLALVVRDERASASTRVRGELVGAADELVTAFALTLVASPQTQRTYQQACRAFTAWLGPLAGPEDLTATKVAAYHAELVRSGGRARRSRRSARRSTRSCAGSSSLSTSARCRRARRSR